MYLEYSSNIDHNSRAKLKTQSNDKDKERKRQSTGNIKESIQLQFQQKRKKARNERQPWRGRAFSRSLWISPNSPRCCCPSDSSLGDRKVCIRCQKLKREEYIKGFIVCKAKPRALPMWYNQMHCKQKHLNFKTRYIATYIKEAHNLASLFFVILRQNTSSSCLFTWPSPCVCWTSGLIALDHPWPVVSDSTKGSLGGESCYSQSYD